MNKIKLNETPVRTSRNFNINNIKLENCKFYILLVEKHRSSMFFLFSKPFCYEQTSPLSSEQT